MHRSAALLSSDQASLLQQLEMLGNGGLCHAKPTGDGVNTLGMLSEETHNCQSGLGREGLMDL